MLCWLKWDFSQLRFATPCSICMWSNSVLGVDRLVSGGREKRNKTWSSLYISKAIPKKLACQTEFFYRRWGMLSVAIDKFNRESTLQREVKLDTGEFDPLPATLRHFLLNLAAVRDDGLTAKEQNKRWGEMLEDGRMSEDMRPLWWEITEFIMVTDVNGFPTFSFFFPPRCIILSRWNLLTVRKQVVSGFMQDDVSHEMEMLRKTCKEKD